MKSKVHEIQADHFALEWLAIDHLKKSNSIARLPCWSLTIHPYNLIVYYLLHIIYGDKNDNANALTKVFMHKQGEVGGGFEM